MLGWPTITTHKVWPKCLLKISSELYIWACLFLEVQFKICVPLCHEHGTNKFRSIEKLSAHVLLSHIFPILPCSRSKVRSPLSCFKRENSVRECRNMKGASVSPWLAKWLQRVSARWGIWSQFPKTRNWLNHWATSLFHCMGKSGYELSKHEPIFAYWILILDEFWGQTRYNKILDNKSLMGTSCKLLHWV